MASVCIFKTEIEDINVLSTTDGTRGGFIEKCIILKTWGEWYPLGKKGLLSGYVFSYKGIVMAYYLGFDLTTEEGVREAVSNSSYIRTEYNNLVAKHGHWENIIEELKKNIPKNDNIKINSAEEMQTNVCGSTEKNEVLEKIEKLGELKKQGILTEEEFESKKKDLLGKI